MWNIIAGFDTLITDYSYNSQDQMTSYTHTNDEDDRTFKNTYDYAGRLSSVYYYIGPPDMPNQDEINLSEYDYNANSQVLQQRLNEGSLKNDYFYNNRNWVEEMIQSEGLFNYINGYYKNGNVKTQQLSGGYNEDFSISSDLSYTYNYDKSNRLTESRTPDKNYELLNTYDKDGNILSLERTNGGGSNSDNFSYVYYSGTNKLQRVSGAGNQFSYDANGNLIQDAFNNNNEILYDHRNLITELKHRSQIIGDTVYLTKYYYDEAGNRIRKKTYAYLGSLAATEPPANSDVSNTNNWSIRNDEVYSRDVSGRDLAIYKNNSVLEYPFYGLDMVGKIKGDELYFYLKDHLGSIRAVLYDNKIYSSQDYDAWGYILENRNYDSDDSKFKFTGKERDEESEYDYFGARYYESRIGRWGGIDPLLEKHIDFTPYNYVLNNPLILVDPKGEQVFVAFGGYGLDQASYEIDPSEYSKESSSGANVLLENISEYKNQNNFQDLRLIGYYASFGKSEISSAYDFITKNLSNSTEPIALYGLSLGGSNINELADLLISMGIENPIFLITVDAFNLNKEFSGLKINSKVSLNYNYFQENEAFLFDSRGFHSKSDANNVVNFKVTNVDHYNIDEATNSIISGHLRSYFNRWKDRR